MAPRRRGRENDLHQLPVFCRVGAGGVVGHHSQITPVNPSIIVSPPPPENHRQQAELPPHTEVITRENLILR